MDFIITLEEELGIKAIKQFEKMQAGDVEFTFSDSSKIHSWIGFRPNTSIYL